MDLTKYIDNEMEARGIKKFKYVSEMFFVDSPKKQFNLDRYIYLLVSRKVDIMPYAKVNMISDDNFFEFNKQFFENCELATYQFFQGNLEVITENNATDIDASQFIPYYLEMLKIIPLI